MTSATPQTRVWAQCLIAYEAEVGAGAESDTSAGFLACEKLRLPLATLMGKAGVSALTSRTLALASAEVPALAALRVNADGTILGLEALEAGVSPVDIAEGSLVLLARLLGLLVMFIGEDLTARVVGEVWPKLFPLHSHFLLGSKYDKTK